MKRIFGLQRLNSLSLIIAGLVVTGVESTTAVQYAMLSLSNLDSNQPIFVWPSDGPRTLAPIDGTFVQILGGPRPDELDLLDTQIGETFGLVAPGFFDARSYVMTNAAPRSTGWFQIRAWRGDQTWEAARNNPNALIGQSEIFENPTGIFEPPNNTDPSLFVNAPSFTMFPVPEPAPWALLALGTSIYLLATAARKPPG